MGKHIQYVAYPGIVERGITKAQFKALGVDHDDVWFTNANHNQIDVTDEPDEVLAVFAMDTDFKLVETDGTDVPKAPKSMRNEPYPEARDLSQPKGDLGEQPKGGEGSADSTTTTGTASSSSSKGARTKAAGSTATSSV